MNDVTITRQMVRQLQRTLAGRLAVKAAVAVFQVILILDGLSTVPSQGDADPVMVHQESTTAAVVEHEPQRRFPDWLGPCSIEGAPQDALCGTYPVWENQRAKRGRRIDLFVAVLPATGPGPVSEPVFPLAGGPGQPSSSFLPFATTIVGELRKNVDVVMVDQRGTGRSHPLRCERPDLESPNEAFTDFRAPDFVRRCLEKQDADVTQYTTEQAVHDLDVIRSALGYERINLFGGSYGSRPALHYLRRYPAQVRAVVVDGVSPSWAEELNPFPRAFERTLDNVFRQCGVDEGCAAAYPQLRADWAAALAHFDEGPIRQAAGPGDGDEVVIPKDLFTDGVRRILYNVHSWSQATHVIHAAAKGDFEPFVRGELRWRRTIHDLSLGMLLTIVCSETQPFLTDAEIERSGRGTSMGSTRVRTMKRGCETWKPAAMPADWRKPLRSKAPVLLLSGAVDPATPHEVAAAAAQTLPNSLHVIIPNRSHSPTDTPCELSVLQAFLATGSGENVDLTCVNETAWPAFRPPVEREALAKTIDPSAFAELVGRYEIQPGVFLRVVLEESQLFVIPPGASDRERLLPEGDRTFFIEGIAERVTFEVGPDGRIEKMTIQNGPSARRVP